MFEFMFQTANVKSSRKRLKNQENRKSLKSRK